MRIYPCMMQIPRERVILIWRVLSRDGGLLLTMEISSIRLTDYRNYADQTLDFAPGINVLAGGNAQGKTNMLEAVRLCSIGRSHRTPRDKELIREGTHQARIALKWRKRDGSHDLSALLPDTSAKQMRVDGKLLRRSGELMGMIATVLFAPEDLMLVKSGPGERRRFIDMELSQIRPVYYYSLQRYNRALKQRNNLLREIAANPALAGTLDSWDEILASEGAQIVKMRADFVEMLSGFAGSHHAHITDGRETLVCRYAGCTDAGDALRGMAEGLARARKRDMIIGSTTFGPHRDDLELMIDGRDVRAFGSQGQQRTTALSLKLSELSVMYNECGEWPILLLDDVMSELDPQRRRMLLDCISGVQTIVTCTDIDDLAGARIEKAMRVDAGHVTAWDKGE